MDFTKSIEFHWFSLIYSSPTSWAEDFNFTNLCTSRWAVAASGWVQRFGKLNKNINAVVKIQKIALLDENNIVFSIFPVRCLPQSLLISYSISLILCTMLDYAEYCYHQEQYSCEKSSKSVFFTRKWDFLNFGHSINVFIQFPKALNPSRCRSSSSARAQIFNFETLHPASGTTWVSIWTLSLLYTSADKYQIHGFSWKLLT